MNKVLSSRWLQSHKLTLPADRLETLEAQAISELEMRVGNSIAERLTSQQMDEFEKFYNDNKAGKATDDDGLAWLERNYPDYKTIVLRESSKMRCELLAAPDIMSHIQQWQPKA